MIKAKIKTEEVKMLLVRRNMTQTELGEKTGISRKHIGEYVSGQRNVGAKIRKRIANVLTPSVFDDLFEIIGEKR